MEARSIKNLIIESIEKNSLVHLKNIYSEENANRYLQLSRSMVYDPLIHMEQIARYESTECIENFDVFDKLREIIGFVQMKYKHLNDYNFECFSFKKL